MKMKVYGKQVVLEILSCHEDYVMFLSPFSFSFSAGLLMFRLWAPCCGLGLYDMK